MNCFVNERELCKSQFTFHLSNLALNWLFFYYCTNGFALDLNVDELELLIRLVTSLKKRRTIGIVWKRKRFYAETSGKFCSNWAGAIWRKQNILTWWFVVKNENRNLKKSRKYSTSFKSTWNIQQTSYLSFNFEKHCRTLEKSKNQNFKSNLNNKNIPKFLKTFDQHRNR